MDPTLNTDDFDGAFAEAAGSYDGLAPAAPETPVEPSAPAVEQPSAEEQKPAVEQPAAAPATPAAEQQPAIDPKYLAQAIAEEQARRASEQEAARKATEQQQQQQKPATLEDFLDDAGKKAIATFESEWPSEYQAVKNYTAAAVQAAVVNSRRELISELNRVLAPIVQSVEQTKVNAHMTAIRAAHPDADAIVPSLREWIAAQPAMIRGTLQEVFERGSSEQVVELMGMYKSATKPTGAAPATPASPAAQEQQAAPEKAKVPPAALAATAAVPATQRSTKRDSHDPNDFDAGFADALGAL